VEAAIDVVGNTSPGIFPTAKVVLLVHASDELFQPGMADSLKLKTSRSAQFVAQRSES
jgi:hypothetical protein